MKKIITLFTFIVAGFNIGFAQWNIINVGTTQDLYSVDYYSGNDIWIGSVNQVVKTGNGGSSWNTINPIKDNSNISISPATVNDLALTSSSAAIGTGFFLLGNSELILNTLNGGVNWNYASINNTVGLPRYINSVDLSAARAVAVGNNGRIAYSTNSGTSWTFVPSGVTSMIYDVKFGTYDTVYASGDNEVFRSVNGGVTWSSQSIMGGFKSIGCDRGVVYLGNAFAQTILKSINFGATYTTINIPFAYQGILYAINKDTLLVSGNDGLYVSRSGGQYWERYILPSYQRIKMLDFLNANTGMAVGEAGYALKTNSLSTAPRVPVSVFSIVGSPSSYCVGDNISFTNFTIPGCTYQWKINGVNFSSSYNSSVTLGTSGSQTISLISTNSYGSDTTDIAINVTGHSIVNTFTFSSNVDTICDGFPPTFSLPLSESGVGYQLRRNYVNVGGVQFGTGSTLTFSTVPASGTNVYSIKAFVTNACFTDSVVKFKTVYSATAPASGLFYVSKDTACYNDTASLIIPNSLSGFKYTWYNSTLGTSGTAYVNGTGSTIVIPLPAITAGNSYAPKAINISKGCSSVLTPAKMITVDKTFSYFTLDNFNPEVGMTVYTINNSFNPMGSYQWDFGTGASTQFSNAINLSNISYSSAGPRSVKLITTTPFGCRDSLTKKVHVILPFINDTCSFTQAASNRNGGEQVALAHDYQDNIIYWYNGGPAVQEVAYSNHGDSVKTTIASGPGLGAGYFLTKYNSKGVPKWTTKLGMGGSGSTKGDIETDTAGNIYCTYLHEGFFDSLRIYSADENYVALSPPFSGTYLRSVVIMKYNKDGILQWYNTYLEDFSIGLISIKADNYGNIYVCSATKLNKYNNSGQLVWSVNGSFSDLDIDNQGFIWTSANDIRVQKYDSAGTLLFTSPAVSLPSSVIATQYLKLDELGNIYLTGVFRGKFSYNNDTISDPYVGGPVHEDVFLCKMKPNGRQEWLKQFKSNAPSNIKGLDVKHNHVVLLVTNEGSSVLVTGLPSLSMSSMAHYIYHTDSLGGAQSINKLYETPLAYIIGGGDGHLIRFKKNSDDLTLAFEFNTNFSYSGTTVYPYGLGDSIHSFIIESGALGCLLPAAPSLATPYSYYLSSSSSVCEGQTISFTDVSSHGATSWNWSFPGGTPSSSTAQNPIVTYNTPGLYSAGLTASNGAGPGTYFTNTINVMPNPNISISGDSVTCEGGTSTLAISATGSIVSYQWQDSTSLHTWTDIPGETLYDHTIYSVTNAEDGNKYRCMVAASCGLNISRPVSLVVSLPPPAVISPSSDTIICAGDSVVFTSNTGAGLSFMWHFNNANILDAEDYQYVAHSAGLYSVLVISSPGCFSSSSDVNLIIDPDCITGITEQDNNEAINIYPNPYSDQVTIVYNLNNDSEVEIEIFNSVGEKVQAIVNVNQPAGNYQYSFSAKQIGMDAGIYFVKITIDGKSTMKRIVEMK